MSEFKIGDTVSITGRQDGLNFRGQIGVIHCKDPYNGGRWGINFETTNFASHNLHRLDSVLPERTGYYVSEAFLTLLSKSKREKTGFSRFIQKVETV